jgi:hypothetical protein
MAIVGIARAEPRQFWEENDTWSLAIGGLAYAFIFAMAATAFDRSVNWLGARSWKILHTVGAYYIWLTYMIVLVTFALDAPRYWLSGPETNRAAARLYLPDGVAVQFVLPGFDDAETAAARPSADRSRLGRGGWTTALYATLS